MQPEWDTLHIDLSDLNEEEIRKCIKKAAGDDNWYNAKIGRKIKE